MSRSADPPYDLPNPFTPMAFLPLDVAFQLTVKAYVTVGTLAVFIWDLLSSLSEDYLLLTKFPVRAPTITYFVSRVSTLIYIIACTLFDTTPIKSCQKLGRMVDWFIILVISSTSFLFVLRVWAVFNHNRFIVAFFFGSWLLVVGASSTVGFGLRGSAGNIGTTKYCIYTHTTPYISSSFIVPFVHDTLIFTAITWQIVWNSSLENHNLRRRMKMAIFGAYLPVFSRALLQDGQLYYLSIVASGLVTVIIFYLPFAPAYKILSTLPNIILMNIMACRVFRSTKFGHHTRNTLTTVHLRFSASNEDSSSSGAAASIPLSLISPPSSRILQDDHNRIHGDPNEEDRNRSKGTDTIKIKDSRQNNRTDIQDQFPKQDIV